VSELACGQAVILAGGRGTRLAAVLGNAPKPTVPMLGTPSLARQIALLAAQGIRDVLLLVGHRQEVIRAHFGDGSAFGVALRYRADDPPLGTAGGLLSARDVLAPRFVVLFGDALLDVDFARAIGWHVAHKADVTLFVHPNDYPHDSDLVEVRADDRVTALAPCPHPAGRSFHNLVNAAVYVVERAAIANLPTPDRHADIARQLIPALVASGRRVYAYRTTEYVKDIGTPERLAEGERALASGHVTRCRLDALRPAVFLDRDGTLNIDTGWIDRPERLTLTAGAGAAVRRINKAGVFAVVVTTQPVVARGDCSEATLDTIHARLETLLGHERAYLDTILFCPHHPDGGFAGERPDLKIGCDCRKPAPGLVRRAAATLPIDLIASCVIGDTARDVGLARNAGIPSVLVATNGTRDRDPALAAEADFPISCLTDAAEFVVEVLPDAIAQARNIASAIACGDWVIVGGPAYSGKTTLARALRFALRAPSCGDHRRARPLDCERPISGSRPLWYGRARRVRRSGRTASANPPDGPGLRSEDPAAHPRRGAPAAGVGRLHNLRGRGRFPGRAADAPRCSPGVRRCRSRRPPRPLPRRLHRWRHDASRRRGPPSGTRAGRG